MFLAVRLYYESKLIIVPLKWIEGSDKIKKINKTAAYYAFNSPDKTKEAIFEKNLYLKKYNDSVDGLYKVAVKGIFGKFFLILNLEVQ
jgi:hypothetical protein